MQYLKKKSPSKELSQETLATVENTQEQSLLPELNEKNNLQEIPTTSVVQELPFLIPENIIINSVEDETHELMNSSLCLVEQVDLLDPSTWIDGKLTQQLRVKLLNLDHFKKKILFFHILKLVVQIENFQHFFILENWPFAKLLNDSG